MAARREAALCDFQFRKSLKKVIIMKEKQQLVRIVKIKFFYSISLQSRKNNATLAGYR